MWAHSANAAGRRHALVDHLHGTAQLAQQFAEPFGAAAFYAGLTHDSGKASVSWQQGLLQAEATRGRVGVDHKTLGIHLAGARGAGLLQLVLHGHHGASPTRKLSEAACGTTTTQKDDGVGLTPRRLSVTSFPSCLPRHRFTCRKDSTVRWSRSS
jgi:CRISPR-associated endonuclease Cas3-HD